jgi:hypothetical protein
MKTSLSAALSAAFAMIYLIPSSRSMAQSSTLPAGPVGWLNASSAVVRAGSNPVLSWNITYPATVVDYITVTPPAVISAKQELQMEVRVLGAGVTSSNSNGSNLSFVPTEAMVSYDGSSFSRIFYGRNQDVDTDDVVYSRTVKVGKSIRFGGRYYHNNAWSTFYHSTSGTMNVRTLVNGQVPPTTYPLHTAPTLENFLKPYLDASGKVRIGPMDVIVFMELTHTDAQKNNQGYDLQDMVLLVTFEPKD